MERFHRFHRFHLRSSFGAERGGARAQSGAWRKRACGGTVASRDPPDLEPRPAVLIPDCGLQLLIAEFNSQNDPISLKIDRINLWIRSIWVDPINLQFDRINLTIDSIKRLNGSTGDQNGEMGAQIGRIARRNGATPRTLPSRPRLRPGPTPLRSETHSD